MALATDETTRSAELPLRAPACPLCERPNGCAVAASGSFDTPCWCRDISFSDELLARIPQAQRNKACVCRACAEASSGAPA